MQGIVSFRGTLQHEPVVVQSQVESVSKEVYTSLGNQVELVYVGASSPYFNYQFALFFVDGQLMLGDGTDTGDGGTFVRLEGRGGNFRAVFASQQTLLRQNDAGEIDFTTTTRLFSGDSLEACFHLFLEDD